MAGAPLTNSTGKDCTVRPKWDDNKCRLATMSEEAGELPEEEMVEQVVVDKETAQWEELVDRYDELMETFNEQFGRADEPKVKGPPMVTPPPKPIREEWEKHQLTHTHTLSILVYSMCSGTSSEAQTSQQRQEV